MTLLLAGRFEVEAQLGRGGMAAVYRVRDIHSGERYALKRVDLKDDKRATRRRASLEREFRTLAQLRHPRIIEVYDYGVDEHGPYYTMELLDGKDLDQDGRVPWQEACALLRDVASSLAIVHSRGLIHRDISGRNVRRTADGRSKLIDFGALVSMGVTNDVVGTPPFMAPEALQLQALDARADLFSLGALGYYLLTGRHAYPARRASELRDVWRTRPTPPSRIVPAVPAALSALVMQLLALDRGARPHTAAEVMERLCVIADLSMEDLPAIMRGYLTTPTLVGRHAALLVIRTRMLSLVRGDGCALVLEGPAGSGRSRMLDACVFEGKLMSTHVVRADAGDGDEPWGVARALASLLFSTLRDDALEATRMSTGVLSYLIEELPAPSDVDARVPDRSVLLRSLRDFVLSLAKRRSLLIAVDDADCIDEPSMAWLASLADNADRHKLMIVVTTAGEQATDDMPPLHLFRSLAHRVTLPPLDAEQTEALIRSMFGDTERIGSVAGHIHALAHGSPRAIVELAQHLVDRGLARYEAGSWVLPSNLDPDDMPATLAAALAQRVAELSQDARELVEIASVVGAQAFDADAYDALTRHRDPERVFLALEELVAARVLVAGTLHYRFTQRGFMSVLNDGMPAARRAELHGRYAAVLAQGDEPLRRAHHLLEAGQVEEAVALLCELDLHNQLPPLPLLECVVDHAERMPSLPARQLHKLRTALLGRATVIMEAQSFRRCLPAVLDQLVRDSGLEAYRALDALPEAQRLSAAFSAQQQRYLELPERDRVYDVFTAVRELSRVTGFVCGVAASVFDLELLERLPDLRPLLGLSPALQIVNELKTATSYWITGRALAARQIYDATLQRIEAVDRAGLDEAQLFRVRVSVYYVLGLIEATFGMDRPEELARILEGFRPLRVGAWRMRSLMHLTQGDVEAATKAMRRAELLQLQDERDTHYPGTGVGLQLQAYCLADDLIGVKRMLEAVEANAERHRGWRSIRSYGESCYRMLSGDLEDALERVQAGLALAKPGESMPFSHLAALHVRILRGLGRLDEAVTLGREYAGLCRRENITMAERFVRLEYARALASAGHGSDALGLLDPLIHEVRVLGSRGLALGVFHEARAYVALDMRDRAAFLEHAERCSQEYQSKRNPALSAKFARLMEAARQLELAPAEAPQFEKALQFASESDDGAEESTIISRILECVDADDRARCVLTMLLQKCDCHLGYLFGVRGDRLVAVAGLPNREPEPELERWLVGWLCAQCEREAHAGAVTTVTEVIESSDTDTNTAEREDGAHGSYVDAEGRRYVALMLLDLSNAERRLAAVLVLQLSDGALRGLSMPKLARIARQLVAHGDVQHVRLADVPRVLVSVH